MTHEETRHKPDTKKGNKGAPHGSDFKRLMEMDLIEQKGSDRATHYFLKE